MQEGKQYAEAGGSKCLLIMDGPICKHKNTSLLPRVESHGPLLFRNFSQLCLTLLTNACSQQDHDKWLKDKVKLSLKSKSGLFRMLRLQHCPEQAETEEQKQDWLEQMNS